MSPSPVHLPANRKRILNLMLNHQKQNRSYLKVNKLLLNDTISNRKRASLIQQLGILEDRSMLLNFQLADARWENAVRKEAASKRLSRLLAPHINFMKSYYWNKGLEREKKRARANYARLTRLI